MLPSASNTSQLRKWRVVWPLLASQLSSVLPSALGEAGQQTLLWAVKEVEEQAKGTGAARSGEGECVWLVEYCVFMRTRFDVAQVAR